AIQENSSAISAKELKSFTDKLYYISGDYSDPLFYDSIKVKLAELDKKHKVDGSVVFYLAVPPFLYSTIV
ncbi:unnamed protein product, partial [marine sediment metagenome]